MIACPPPYDTDSNESLKLTENKPEVWDLLGQPSGKFDYKVKYTAPPSAYIRREDIVPSGWGDEFDEEDGIVRVAQPQGPRRLWVLISGTIRMRKLIRKRKEA